MADSDSIEHKTLTGGKAYAFISIFSQIISWVFTFVVIRLLDPQDYGLMSMASFLTSFIFVFSNLGLGAGVVQRETVNQAELSSVFWFSILVGLIMSIAVFGLAYPNALIFENEQLVPITQLVSIMFITSSIGTVPQNILSRNYQFKDIALINMSASFITSIISVWMAYSGFGVYTLIYSAILLGLIKSIGYLWVSKWIPSVAFSLQLVKPFLKFGVTLSIADSITRLLETFDRLIIGKLYNEVLLGYYATAINLSSMPIDKLSPLINPVLLPMFSRWQNDSEKSSSAYLKVLKYYLFLMSHIYMGALLVADNLILVVLGEKWVNTTYIFKGFCIVQLFKVLSSYHKVLLTSQGKASQILKYDVVMTILLMLSILIAALDSFESVVIAWVSVYPVVTIIWMLTSLSNSGVAISNYSKTILIGSVSSIVMFAVTFASQWLFRDFYQSMTAVYQLIFQFSLAGFTFLIFVAAFQRNIVVELLQLFKSR
ncbi:lipopolysaccharide biosynthesis protein [Pleionea sediminis]|uniref:lipopolysaccharide biosynthesis protein n=1 Tax=Pleionea sediminis TaxID=2569479 RepID=UPI0011848664|nr:lipopolysaccharide biosynthesis protein [Pleionea sediminis]